MTERMGQKSQVSLLDIFLQEVGSHPLLEEPEETRLSNSVTAGIDLEKNLQDKEPSPEQRTIIRAGLEAQKRLVECNLRLVVSIASRYQHHPGMTLEDLIQEGNIGLMRAIQTHDPEKGRVSTHATPSIGGAILRAIGKQSRTIRLPAHAYQRQGELKTEMEKLVAQLGQDPQNIKIRQRLKYVEEQLWRIGKTASVSSLDEPTKEGGSTEKGEFIASGEPPVSTEAERANLRKILLGLLEDGLKEREVRVLSLHYGLELTDDPDQRGVTHTLEEIGQEMSITRERVRQIKARALRKLRFHAQLLRPFK